jgi:hypothetical protein
MFVGYALDHEGDCYQMWDPNTSRVHESRDITWLRRMFFQHQLPAEDMALEPIAFVTPDLGAREGVDNSDDSEEEEENDDQHDKDGGGKATLQAAVTRSGRTVPAPGHLIEEIISATANDYEIGLTWTMSETRYYAIMKEYPDGEYAPGEVVPVCVGAAGLGGGFENTKKLHVMKFKKAMASEDAKKWEEAADKEHYHMVNAGAWKEVPVADVPSGEKIITST